MPGQAQRIGVAVQELLIPPPHQPILGLQAGQHDPGHHRRGGSLGQQVTETGLTTRFQGRDYRLTDVHGNVLQAILT